MNEYIKRDSVCYQLEKQATIDGQPRAIRRAAKIVADFPAADVRPVVLCRDCKYWFNAPVADGFNSCERDALIRHENFFCAAGKKREES